MKLLIAVPSKNRLEILTKYTWSWLQNVKVNTFIFVEPQDYPKYVSVIPRENVVSLLEDNKGLGYAKSFIKNFASENGYDIVFKLDDDIKCFTDFRKTVTTEDMPEKFERILRTCVDTLTAHESVGAISFPYSFEMYERPTGWEESKRLQTAYIIKTAVMLDDPRINVFEDFASGLYILANGGKILKYGLSGIDCGVAVGGGTGGHQSYDRSEQALKEIEFLRIIYPPLKAKKVDKPWKIEPDMRSVRL